jgi:GNAT superfamily N-acetyltransferase
LLIERDFPDGTRIVSVEHDDGAVELALEAGGEKVGATVIVPMLMRIGAAVVRMDGIGGVATEEAYRGRGFGVAVVSAWRVAVESEGRMPLYSTWWDNAASLGVARRLGLVAYAETLSLR